jgi:hypothetical protein
LKTARIKPSALPYRNWRQEATSLCSGLACGRAQLLGADNENAYVIIEETKLQICRNRCQGFFRVHRFHCRCVAGSKAQSVASM